jgi:hypothetical protein
MSESVLEKSGEKKAGFLTDYTQCVVVSLCLGDTSRSNVVCEKAFQQWTGQHVSSKRIIFDSALVIDLVVFTA